MMGHMLAAQRLPEMAMTQEEADQLATAIANYAKHTKVQISPKTEAFLVMMGTIAMVEGRRFVAVARRLAAEKMARKQPAGNVVPMTDTFNYAGYDQHGRPA